MSGSSFVRPFLHMTFLVPTAAAAAAFVQGRHPFSCHDRPPGQQEQILRLCQELGTDCT
jgi:hypothetical protein